LNKAFLALGFSKMVTRLLTVETPAQFEVAVSAAAELLSKGEVVALPTETVYGLGANAFSESAVKLIYEIKGRPSHNPVIVHVASLESARLCVAHWPAEASALARQFWPGALTLVLPKSSKIPAAVSAGGPTVAIRWPSHPFIQEVIKRCEFPIAAPSANLSNQVSPTTAEHVMIGLKNKIPLIVDAGPSSVGIESTVIDLVSKPPRVLRPGMISSAQLKSILPTIEVTPHGPADLQLRSPGLLKKHYAPHARLKLLSWGSDDELLLAVRRENIHSTQIHVIAYEQIPLSVPFGRVSVIPHDPEAYARALYAELHQSDLLGAALVVVEEPPHTPAWEGIRDRLTRASAEN
jgi:L-threonylcarbamoyladenylate synthase